MDCHHPKDPLAEALKFKGGRESSTKQSFKWYTWWFPLCRGRKDLRYAWTCGWWQTACSVIKSLEGTGLKDHWVKRHKLYLWRWAQSLRISGPPILMPTREDPLQGKHLATRQRMSSLVGVSLLCPWPRQCLCKWPMNRVALAQGWWLCRPNGTGSLSLRLTGSCCCWVSNLPVAKTVLRCSSAMSSKKTSCYVEGVVMSLLQFILTLDRGFAFPAFTIQGLENACVAWGSTQYQTKGSILQQRRYDN